MSVERMTRPGLDARTVSDRRTPRVLPSGRPAGADIHVDVLGSDEIYISEKPDR